MSAQDLTKLNCDYPGCTQHLDYRIDTAEKVRAKAAANRGWTSLLDLDFCPHHPELEKHRPAVDTLPAAHAFTSETYRARCTGHGCGWSDTKAAPGTDTAGWYGAESALRQWLYHLEFEPSALCRRRTKREQDRRLAHLRNQV
jgi:hypothetical protein